MNQVMYSLEETKKKIISGAKLILAGDEKLLAQLPAGSWIGGTTPYFIGDKGGEFSQDKIFVTELPEYMMDFSIKVYDEASLANIYTDAYENGFSIIILPFASKVQLSFALNAPHYPQFATRPLVGWISGVDLNDVDKASPKVFNGMTAEALTEQAVVLNASLPADKIAEVNVINIFEPADGDTFTFPVSGYKAKEIIIRGQNQNFTDYLSQVKADTRFPIVANYYGAYVNISFQSIDQGNKEVHFYAPVFKDIVYQLARPVENYVEQFLSMLPQNPDGVVVFSCNCILNYLHSQLEGKQTGDMKGPITFGEVAYQLLNQTMVYLTILDI